METKFELGPIQREWIQFLRENPNLQMGNALGLKFNDGEYVMCCLGAYGLIANKYGKGNVRWDNDVLRDYPVSSTYNDIGVGALLNSYIDLGLNDAFGKIIGDEFSKYATLAQMNDGGVKWTDIADFVEANPESVFTKSI